MLLLKYLYRNSGHRNSYYDNTHAVPIVTYIHPVALLLITWLLYLEIPYVQSALKLAYNIWKLNNVH